MRRNKTRRYVIVEYCYGKAKSALSSAMLFSGPLPVPRCVAAGTLRRSRWRDNQALFSQRYGMSGIAREARVMRRGGRHQRGQNEEGHVIGG